MRTKFGALFLVVLLPLFACNKIEPQKLAEIDGKTVHVAEVEKNAGKELFELRRRLYDLQKQKLDEYIDAVLLTREAERRQVSVATLLDQEITAKVALSNDEEIWEFYEVHKVRLQVPFGQVREQIREFLREKRVQDRKADFVSSLRAKANVKTFLIPPPNYRANVLVSGAPSIGAEESTVTLVKFEDFQCPYCKMVQPIFADLLKRYSGKLRLVHKDLPLDAIHPQARPAAEAARCAADQGKFWEYHDKLYAQAPKLAVGELKSAAKEIGLNVASFDQCLVGGKFKAAVQRDFSEAARLGLTGTPAFFINGRELSGAQPIEAFTAIIDEELVLAK